MWFPLLPPATGAQSSLIRQRGDHGSRRSVPAVLQPIPALPGRVRVRKAQDATSALPAWLTHMPLAWCGMSVIVSLLNWLRDQWLGWVLGDLSSTFDAVWRTMQSVLYRVLSA